MSHSFMTVTNALSMLGEIGGGGTWMPTQASTIASNVDALFYFIYILCVVSFILVVGASFWFAWKYRRQSSHQPTSPIKHNTRLEVLWSAIPTVLLLVVFAWGQQDFTSMAVAPSDSLEVKVTGRKWNWSVDYPTLGKSCQPDATTNMSRLVVPLGKPVKLTLSSEDVIHSFFIPAFRLKRDALPNRYTGYWFEATQVGEYDLFCTEYCGTSHSKMIGRVIVKTQEDFEIWKKSGDCSLADKDKPEEYGPYLFSSLGCNACHSTDGSKRVGPSFQNLFGATEATSGGSVTVDDNYLRESILEPNAKIVNGYSASMPSYNGRVGEKELDALIYFIKQQSEPKN